MSSCIRCSSSSSINKPRAVKSLLCKAGSPSNATHARDYVTNATNTRKVRKNVADVVDGTAVLIIIHNPLRYSVVCFCNSMPRNKTNSNHLLRIKQMNKNKSQLTLYLKKQTPNNLVLNINDGVSKGRSLASSVVAFVT